MSPHTEITRELITKNSSASPTGIEIPYFEQDEPVCCMHFCDDGYKPHFHLGDIWELSMILKGEGYYFVGSNAYPIHPGMLMLIDQDSVHWFGGKGIDRCIIFFSEQHLAEKLSGFARNDWGRLRQFIRDSNNSVLPPTEETARLELLFTSVLHEYEKKDTGYLNIMYALTSTIVSLYVRYSSLPQERQKRYGHSQEMLIQEILKHIEAHTHEHIDLKSLARHAGVTENYLSTIFNKIVGHSLPEYIAIQRVNVSRLLLESSNLKITAIAYEAGFSSVSNFNRTFKRIVGISPSKYREMIQSAETVLI